MTGGQRNNNNAFFSYINFDGATALIDSNEQQLDSTKKNSLL
jgi:hypothetical protein